MKYLILLLTISCVTTKNNKIKPSRRDRDRHNYITCIKDLFETGISAEKAETMCKTAVSLPYED